jgi:hypothetical protein
MLVRRAQSKGVAAAASDLHIIKTTTKVTHPRMVGAGPSHTCERASAERVAMQLLDSPLTHDISKREESAGASAACAALARAQNVMLDGL